jgi:hypothetical protein
LFPIYLIFNKAGFSLFLGVGGGGASNVPMKTDFPRVKGSIITYRLEIQPISTALSINNLLIMKTLIMSYINE